jgi:ribosomal protein L11 methyltransferase
MAWVSVSMTAAADEIEALSEALLDAGAISVDIADAAAGTASEQPIFAEPGVPAPGRWTRETLSALFQSDAEISVVMRAALSQAGLPDDAPYRLAPVHDRDWVRATQDQFTPQQISPRLWIVPSWHVPPDPAAINVILDPGLAFGTGTHPTTRLCLRWLDGLVRGGESVIDFGCGSGILAIAALKLGAGHAYGVDIDEQALLAARTNAMQNRVDAVFLPAADRLARQADIVVANILAHPLIILAPVIAGLTRSGGRIALSGILDAQAAEVALAYREWFDIEPGQQDDGWVLLSGVKR